MASPDFNTRSRALNPFDPAYAYEARRGPSSPHLYAVTGLETSLTRASTSYVPSDVAPRPQDSRQIRGGLLWLIMGGESAGEIPPDVLTNYNDYLGDESGLFVQLLDSPKQPTTITVAKVVELRRLNIAGGGLILLVKGHNGATGTLEDGTSIFFSH